MVFFSGGGRERKAYKKLSSLRNDLETLLLKIASHFGGKC